MNYKLAQIKRRLQDEIHYNKEQSFRLNAMLLDVEDLETLMLEEEKKKYCPEWEKEQPVKVFVEPTTYPDKFISKKEESTNEDLKN